MPSDPFLMTGSDKKCVHLENLGAEEATFTVEVDVHGHGRFGAVAQVAVPAGQLPTHVIPSGFSAHWVRIVSDRDTTASAQLFHT
ncbi:hypothetical protein ACF1BN_08835 [Streptomyces sp. NPDC014861]|uniref:hypothetical protein n=1 Tax=Streptomyces sp. NPDC014861 TaxID=3364923 RepID=UPI0036FD9C02